MQQLTVFSLCIALLGGCSAKSEIADSEPASTEFSEPADDTAVQDQREAQAQGEVQNTVARKGKPVSEWLKDLRSNDYGVQTTAIKALQNLGTEATPVWIEALNTESHSFEERNASQNLEHEARKALVNLDAAVVPELTEALKAGNTGVIDVLGEIGPEAKDAVPALIDVLESEIDDSTLGLSHLGSALKSRIAASNALGRIGRAAMPGLLELLKHHEDQVQGLAAEALGVIGPEAEDAGPGLILLLNDEYSYVRANAARALVKIGLASQDTMSVLINCSTDEEPHIRILAVDAFQQMGPDAVPALIGVLKDDHLMVQRAAISALGKLGPAAASAVPSLQEISQNGPQSNRGPATRALEEIGGKD